MKAKIFENTPSRSPRGFTLVELLVVITIIVVLAAVGFPAMTKMRSNAARSKCLDQFREWGIITATYSAENAGKIEWDRWESIGTDPAKVSVYLPYMTTGEVDVSTKTDQGSYGKLLAMRHCPAVKDPATVVNATVNYAMIRAQPPESMVSYNTLAKISNPSRFILMSESNSGSGTLSTGGDFTANVKPLTLKGAPRHDNATVNVLLADFSVRLMSWKDLEKGLSYWTTY
jgi:prepilin-type N-terminal cleavage/methylation domain-containing protein/prepilin-type processing-associated H-X9-DG protein